MRRLLDIRLDAFQFQRLHGSGLALNLFFQTFQQFPLFNHNAVQLLNLVFEMSNVRL